MIYNELLVVLMAFLTVLMIVMALVVLIRPKRQQRVQEEKVEPVEKILVERGFEKEIANEPNIKEETNSEYTPVFIETETIKNDYEELHSEYINEIEPEIIREPPKHREPEIYYTRKPEESEDYSQTPGVDKIITPDSISKIEEILQTEYKESTIESQETQLSESSLTEPTIDEQEAAYFAAFKPKVSEPTEEVLITPTQTFYDSIPEYKEEKIVPTLEGSPTLEEQPEAEIDLISEIELPPLEADEQKLPEEDLEPEIEEPESEPVIPMVETLEMRARKRIRKPIIDENDENIKIDLGVETCPHCGSKVPDTIYCINCGKALNKNHVEEEPNY